MEPPFERPAWTHIPRADGTIWYMGAKTRLLGRIEEAAAAALPKGRRAGPLVVDLFTGTGVVAARLATRARVIAADVQSYAATLAGAALLPAGRARDALASFDGAFWRQVEATRDALSERLADALGAEDAFLASPKGSLDVDAYRTFSARTVERDPERAAVALRAEGHPACLCSTYYGSVYFGVRQAIDLDALRFAVEGLGGDARLLGLAALLFAASKATSATAHFAQPRALGRASEVRILASRRRIDIPGFFSARLARSAEAAGPSPRPGCEAWTGAYPEVFQRLARRRVDLVYADPPYTQDNYSRFYHALEVIARYDYPALERRGGRLLKGRYPERADRFVSGFTRAGTVEDEFDRVTALAASRGAALIWSYSETNGLLVRRIGLEGLEALLGRHYQDVAIERIALRHSGAGDKNHDALELLVVCRGPRRAAAAPRRASRAGRALARS